MASFNHAYTLSYEVAHSEHPQGMDVTARMHAAAIMCRVAEILSMPGNGFDECVGAPDDTYEER